MSLILEKDGMRIGDCLFLFLWSTSLGVGELVPLWDYLGRGDVEQRKFYIEKARFEKLGEIDLLKEEPKLTVGQAAQIAHSSLGKSKNSPFKVESIELSFSLVKVKGKRLCYYKVVFEDVNGQSSDWVYVGLDGKIIPSMTSSGWKKAR